MLDDQGFRSFGSFFPGCPASPDLREGPVLHRPWSGPKDDPHQGQGIRERRLPRQAPWPHDCPAHTHL